MLGLDFPDRAALYRRIDLRVDKMLEAGLLAEAEYVWHNREAFRTAAQAIGYKEFFPYFQQTATLEVCTEKLKQASRNYAKRQLTWFRHMDGVTWLDAGAADVRQTALRLTQDFLLKDDPYAGNPQEPRHKFSALTTLAAVLAAFLLAAAAYVCWQAAHILFPQNVYETALPITISDTIEADGVLLFDETCISGSGNLGYLVSDGERVSAGTAVAELYTDANQAVLRQQLTQLTSQIDLLQRSQNTAAPSWTACSRSAPVRCMTCWTHWTPPNTAMWTKAPMPICWRRTSCGSPPAIPPALRIRSRCLPSRHRPCRHSWATPPRSPPPLPATLSELPAADG